MIRGCLLDTSLLLFLNHIGDKGEDENECGSRLFCLLVQLQPSAAWWHRSNRIRNNNWRGRKHLFVGSTVTYTPAVCCHTYCSNKENTHDTAQYCQSQLEHTQTLANHCNTDHLRRKSDGGRRRWLLQVGRTQRHAHGLCAIMSLPFPFPIASLVAPAHTCVSLHLRLRSCHLYAV